jgi:hypothetical protein
VVSVTDPYGRILAFLDRCYERLVHISSIILSMCGEVTIKHLVMVPQSVSRGSAVGIATGYEQNREIRCRVPLETRIFSSVEALC